MKQILSRFFSCDVEVKEYKEKLNLPIFMTMRQIKLIKLYGSRFAVVDIKNQTDMSVAAMKKQQIKYEEALKCPVAYEVIIDSVAMRNAMVKKGISFIDLPGNVFLPFLGTVLLDVHRKKRIKADHMMPATQMVFLELLYMNDGESALKSEIARRLNITKTSLSRATAQLKEMNLIIERKSGTEIAISRNYQRREYYDKAKPYLVNPTQKVITVEKNEIESLGWLAGESALSSYSELNPPDIEELAIYKGAKILERLKPVDVRFEEHSKCVRLQLWKYDPSLFVKAGIVDPISLVCTFSDNTDERIDICIEKLLEKI